MNKPTVVVIARLWNVEDLVRDWFGAISKWADRGFLLDAGSGDHTWHRLQCCLMETAGRIEGYTAVSLFRLPPGAPMRSGFYTNMLLRCLDDVKPDLVVHLDHDEMLEPEIAECFPRLHEDGEHDAWSIVRRNFAFGRTHYEATAAVLRFREHFCYRWLPGLRHPDPRPNGRPRQQGIHHLERVPLGHPARDDVEPVQMNGVLNYVPRLNARLGHLPDEGPWMLHYSFRDEARNRLQYERLRDGASEHRPNFLTPREALTCPLVEYVPYARRVGLDKPPVFGDSPAEGGEVP